MIDTDEKPSILDTNVHHFIERLEGAWEHHKRLRDSQPGPFRFRELDGDVLKGADALLLRARAERTYAGLDAKRVERLNDAMMGYWDAVEWFGTALQDLLDSVEGGKR
jgi:hypothetical protein